LGILYGLDWDLQALKRARSRLEAFGSRLILIHANFKDLEELKEEHGIRELDGLLFDLGLSALHVEVAERGFAFSRNGPLDMRMDQRMGLQAAELVNDLPERELADLLWQFGEERYARRIAHRIVELRRQERITGTRQLAEIVQRAIPPRSRSFRLHPATRTFQALRIAVNRELEGLDRGIQAGVGLLRPGGRIAVIAYHSLEDRIVKRTFLSLSRGPRRLPDTPAFVRPEEPTVSLLTKKPITPSATELNSNPRSRSAKLRVAERT
jgi:16S rRNA (cytosine1402-N4)-methyltransferase